MKLTNYSDYALRSLIYLAVKPDPHLLANINDIALRYDISKSHLTKIIHQLGQLGYIDSVRGKNGGIRLARAPEDINLGVLIKKIEPDFELVECFAPPSLDNKNTHSQDVDLKKLPLILLEETMDRDKSGCIISPVCQLKNVFSEALTAFIAVLERYTLADIIANKDELSALLS